ncbi:MAG: preprotein translocase subunit SecE [gamma proteobacterium symbiont of Ctena orbiculata]|uniref:Protein translocase subunit SecE n=1 Tax=Candidatus Thiodiazotropha taylori TaxID=2792791 RepID=A0A944MAG8_9GAMM|nr:preprotein translocase subunit SecE [Candidatus Thiodiazotropha taylori]PUB88538.1 MAG: preprotein translocase subunit SecE [gamma proteobacterium symbiont of Ctena orbiculata]MBT2989797.1 preprotein translocase subunit SecE [Candidatus Thiodiazotropha taylori]MBT2995489.1 preprotein translocase subunit SecE [Candidatus Thiodiazotropha taylori]MBT3001507.1 preprotein translocase subunit SecE [Candidatus Thiodiazotropha taylori]
MNSKSQVEASSLDTVKLALAVGIIVGGIYGFYYLDSYSQLLRVLGLLALVAVAAFITYQTTVGRTVWEFASASRIEVRKVVWPSRQETVQTTLIVFVMVLIMGIVLWLFDMMLGAILKALTGTG